LTLSWGADSSNPKWRCCDSGSGTTAITPVCCSSATSSKIPASRTPVFSQFSHHNLGDGDPIWQRAQNLRRASCRILVDCGAGMDDYHGRRLSQAGGPSASFPPIGQKSTALGLAGQEAKTQRRGSVSISLVDIRAGEIAKNLMRLFIRPPYYSSQSPVPSLVSPSSSSRGRAPIVASIARVP